MLGNGDTGWVAVVRFTVIEVRQSFFDTVFIITRTCHRAWKFSSVKNVSPPEKTNKNQNLDEVLNIAIF